MGTLTYGMPYPDLSGIEANIFSGGEGAGVTGTCCVDFCGELHLGCVFLFFLAFSCGCWYQPPDHSEGGICGCTVGSLGTAGIDVLLMVWRWWVGRLWRSTLGAVALLDNYGAPTLEGVEAVTLGGGRLAKILVNSWKIIAGSIFFSFERDSVPSRICNNFSAAIIVLSSSDNVGRA